MSLNRCVSQSCIFLLVFVAAVPDVDAFTVEVVAGGSLGEDIIIEGDEWHYLKGTAAPSDPADAWPEIDFVDAAWATGPSGFGYGDGDDNTDLDDMQGNYVTVYIRKAFTISAPISPQRLQLEIDYDDGFVAYLNGHEEARRRMPEGEVTFETEADNHEAGTPEVIDLGRASDLLIEGTNVLAIEGHNASEGSSDFSLIPALRIAPSRDILRLGEQWITSAQAVTLMGTTPSPPAVSVRIDGTPVDFSNGDWEGAVMLAPGLNEITVEALDGGSAVVDSETVQVVYLSPSDHLEGVLTEDTVLPGGYYIVSDDMTVPEGMTLTIQAGVTLLLKDAVSVLVNGRLLAEGTEAEPVRFTHFGDGATWKQIMFVKAADSRLSHCLIEYADCEGAHQDYYAPGSRDYHEAIVVVASHVDMEGCTFQNLPDSSNSAEGDAIAIISDDPDQPGEASALVKGCQFLAIGQGVHTRFSYVLVEECFFTGKNGDNDDVDLWGESDPPPLILNNRFIDPDHDDMINPTKCSAIIIGNVIAGSDDHGVVLRDKGTPIMMNNIIYNCSSAGIAVENTCNALLVNNTIYDCGRGLRLLDLGRAGPPYYLTPGGGTAKLVNCIIWNCPSPITVADSSNTDAEDRGSHVTVIHSDIAGGEDGISVSGSFSTVTWGEGNLDVDPLFVNGDDGDFHLQALSPVIDAGTETDAPATDMDGKSRPCGDGVDMGAYESGNCGSGPQAFTRGDVNADTRVDLSDAIGVLLFLFDSRSVDCESSADANDSGKVDIADAVALLDYLFGGGEAPPAPFKVCGPDPTADDLPCPSFTPCP